MFRLLFVMMLFLAALGAFLAALALMRTMLEDAMTGPFQKIAYVLLILLMFGVTTGWLGGV